MTLIAELRSGTREAHDRLEQDLDVLARCRAPEDYAALLRGFRALYAPLEHALDTSPVTADVVPDWPARRKTAWLDEDLAALGVATPPDRPVPQLRTVEDVAGACYVLEGATLGGAVVVRQLRAALDEPPPHRFFASYGRDRGPMWTAFRGHLAALDRRGADRERAVDAARTTFATFELACR